MTLADVNSSIPLEELNKLVKISVIIDEKIREALEKVRKVKLDKNKKSAQD